MTKKIEASKSFSIPEGSLSGTVQLPPSKSLANRAAVLLSLAGVAAEESLGLEGTPSKDTDIILANLKNGAGKKEFNAGDAGTAYRFLTARLALIEGEKVLTGSERMLERPIGPLVDALRTLGVSVEYLGKGGYPPLKIGDISQVKKRVRVEMDSSLSSQYASALLMIGPYLPHGLHLRLLGSAVSLSYLRMTVGLMRDFGAKVTWRGSDIWVKAGEYTPQKFAVEADWSAASYFYAMAALRPNTKLFLPGLHKKSVQGDAVLAKWFKVFGVKSTFSTEGLHLTSKKTTLPKEIEIDFLESPDMAQTMFVVCAATGVGLKAHNLQTLRIKETDRIKAMQTELGKLGIELTEILPESGQKVNESLSISLSSKVDWAENPIFATYNDHRMAMALAPLALLGEIAFEKPDVVKKSYPTFWEEMANICPF